MAPAPLTPQALLTPRQAEILEFIRNALTESGAPPTRDEIARAFGFRSLNAAEQHLQALQKKGLIELDTTTHIRVNSVNPGRMRTAMRAKAFPGELPETVPTPSAVLAPFLYLLGPDGRGITGRRFDAQ
jgi:repressor LexA